MKNKLKNFVICYISIISFSINAERFGDPGEIIAIKASSNELDKYLTVKINESLYKLIPLPFEKQNDSIYVDGEKININQKDFGESRITIENNSMVNLSKKDSDRAFKESKIIQKALNNYTKFLVPDLNFMNPVEGIISSRYGKKRYINDQPRSPHLSLDIAAAEGTKIVSPSKGKVILVGDFFYAGNYIVIDHGFGLISSYSHLSSVLVNENELIEKGQKIGEVGSTGRVTGPHLHWTVYLNKVRINPESIIQENFLESLL
jgi:murein DD-endopeptidase MepM/ murein hydrolase activator NlpD